MSTTNNQITIDEIKQFIEDGNHEYLTTHKKLCFAIIARIYRRVLNKNNFGPIVVSDGKYIVDGNHRYIAYKLAGYSFEVKLGTHSFSDEGRWIEFKNVDIDTEANWDYNNPNNRRYCNDDFLKNGDYQDI